MAPKDNRAAASNFAFDIFISSVITVRSMVAAAVCAATRNDYHMAVGVWIQQLEIEIPL